MKHYRICKYDPRKRGPEGTYLDLDDWTGPADIGRIIRGQKFTSETFLDWEAKYIRAVRAFFFTSQLSHLRITNVAEIDSEWRDEFQDRWPDLYDPRFDTFSLEEDMTAQGEMIDLAIMMNLRNFQGCQLHLDERFFIHFGWDFYVFIGAQGDYTKPKELLRNDGLFVDEAVSPFAEPQGFAAPYRIEAYGIPSGNRVDELTKSLPDFTKHDLRAAFGYSREHPLFGTFDIGPEIQAALGRITDYDFQPENYSYVLRRDPWM